MTKVSIAALAFVAGYAYGAFPATQYRMSWYMAGQVFQSEPMSKDRCEAKVKREPHLRAVCVPVLR